MNDWFMATKHLHMHETDRPQNMLTTVQERKQEIVLDGEDKDVDGR